WRVQTSVPPSPSRPSLCRRLPIIPPRDNNQISRRRKPLCRDQELRPHSRPTRVYFSRGHKKREAYHSVRHSPSACHRHQSLLYTPHAPSRTSFPPGSALLILHNFPPKDCPESASRASGFSTSSQIPEILRPTASRPARPPPANPPPPQPARRSG